MKLMNENFKRYVFDLEDKIFERRYGFDFGGIITKDDLEIGNSDSFEHGNSYQAVWCRNLRVLLNEVDSHGSGFKNFIDIGSGKGKACLFAYFQRDYKNIIGVEYSHKLVQIAKENKSRVNASNVTFLECDAANFEIPNIKSVIFIFNSFDEVILRKFIEKNLSIIAANHSVIAYANDIHREYLHSMGFKTVYREDDRKISLFSI